MIPNHIQFGKYFYTLHRQEQKHLNHIMQEYGLTSFSYPFIVYLYYNEGLSQRNLCKLLLLDESLATRTMKMLEADGLIIREKDVQDQRAYILSLTDKGRQIAVLLKEEIVKWWSDVLDPLDEDTVALLAAHMDKVSQRAIDLNHANMDEDIINE